MGAGSSGQLIMIYNIIRYEGSRFYRRNYIYSEIRQIYLTGVWLNLNNVFASKS